MAPHSNTFAITSSTRATALPMDPLDAPWRAANLGSWFPAARLHSTRINLVRQSPVQSSRTRHSSQPGTTDGVTASLTRLCHMSPQLPRLLGTSRTRAVPSRNRSIIPIRPGKLAPISNAIPSIAATEHRSLPIPRRICSNLWGPGSLLRQAFKSAT